jgi:hypothetical protein
MISEAFKPLGLVLTMAYYPDKRQEENIVKGRLHEYMDLMHMMSYVKTLRIAPPFVLSSIFGSLPPRTLTHLRAHRPCPVRLARRS